MDEPFGGVFDPDADLSISESHRPHWSQTGAITFITLRLEDSIPSEVVLRWHREKIEFLDRHGIQCGRDWKAGCERLDLKTRQAFDKQFIRAREDCLDSCLGSCVLRRPEAALEVGSSLMHFDEDRYVMGDYVVMPNHIHCLVAFRKGTKMEKQCGSWMHFSATKINRIIGRKGTLWHEEPFDHLVRNENQLAYLRRYIEENPKKANLPPGQFLYRRSAHHF